MFFVLSLSLSLSFVLPQIHILSVYFVCDYFFTVCFIVVCLHNANQLCLCVFASLFRVLGSVD